MINKKDILKMVHHVSKRSRGGTDRRLIHPYREWLIGLCIFLVIVVIGSIFNAQLYNRYNNLASELQEPTSGADTYQAELVASIITQYRAKDRLYNERIAAFTALAVKAEPIATSTPTGATSTEVVSLEEDVIQTSSETETRIEATESRAERQAEERTDLEEPESEPTTTSSPELDF